VDLPASVAYISGIRIAEARSHTLGLPSGKILFHEALMEVIAGPDFVWIP
jgi:hypothetical protein